jgi:hypothetical protein
MIYYHLDRSRRSCCAAAASNKPYKADSEVLSLVVVVVIDAPARTAGHEIHDQYGRPPGAP